MRKLYVALAILIVGGALVLLVRYFWQDLAVRPEATAEQRLYQQNCAVCHGAKGDGKGEAAYLLLPKPRNFRAGQFRLVSSENLQPTREDLFRVITNGMPGTPMPSWAHLPEADRWSLADYVLTLNREGWIEKGMSLGDTRAAAEKYADEMTETGPAIPIPPEPPVTQAGLQSGRQYYLQVCAKCHGEDGGGKFDPTWRTSEGYPTWARNLSQGIFKGGREGKELFLRFYTGMPGTPMPAGELPPEQVWRVVQYVQSLSDPAAQEQAQVRSEAIPAKRLATLPSEPNDPLWADIPAIRVALMPLWWHEGYIATVRVKAAHDGQRLAFRLEWDDATGDVGGIKQQTFPDGAAVQLAAGGSPPLFAMGAAGQPVNIWHWKALWQEDQEKFQDVGSRFPAMVDDAYFDSEKGWVSDPTQDSEFLPALDLQNLVASPRHATAEDANAAGLGTFTSQALEDQNLQGISRWNDGVWRLQLVRTLEASSADDVPLGPGNPFSVAFAVWDGSAGDRNGQKSVSIWNSLRLE